MGNNPLIILIISILFLSSQTISVARESEETKFSYIRGAENGPEKWGKLNTNYTLCNAGQMQSPINIDDSTVNVTSKFGELIQRYEPFEARIINNGNSLQIQWTSDKAGKIIINGTDYFIQNCHCHTPSENTVNGKKYDMEMHLVHKSTKDEFAAVSLLFKIGEPDSFLGQFLNSSIKQVGRNGADLGVLNPRKIGYEGKKYYRFIGSLTTPPCTQGVIWTVIKKSKTLSQDQIKLLKEAVDDGYEKNARPVQPLNGRTVYLNQPKERRCRSYF
ncbi:PREDICTED: alpha carbonic anhydrase 4-like [Ipomoea nil]|uniref:alpha carbonic anhydrase 4-like n=1 Tax=Ipomoea nil TaxID=35883 RepID=UPI000901C18D|nr:PREDICTED: alpha carbonic anhydrase 4-like [Ipomoea nil]